MLDAIAGDHLDANVSVKLTALGLKVDLDLCRSLLATVVADAAARGIFVRIDMEDSTCTDDTFVLYRELREARRDNVGVVLQSCLRRTLVDVAALADLRPSVRLCKGIYVEPPVIAYQGRDEIRRASSGCWTRCSRRVLSGRGDPRRVAARTIARTVGGMPRDAYELQMLLGVRERRVGARRRRPPAPCLCALRRPLVRVLAAPAAGEPALATMLAKATAGRVVPGRR